MGKWAEVHCHCFDRFPRPDSGSFGRPHRNKRRLTKQEKDDVAEWERTTEGMYACGHRHGVVIELWPGDIIHLGDLIGRLFRDEGGAFEVFPEVGDRRHYEDELLLIPPDRAALWLLEIEEIQRALQGSGNLPQGKMEKLVSERPGLESTVGKIAEALADAARLCRASIEMGNPIRMLW